MNQPSERLHWVMPMTTSSRSLAMTMSRVQMVRKPTFLEVKDHVNSTDAIMATKSEIFDSLIKSDDLILAIDLRSTRSSVWMARATACTTSASLSTASSA